jgi:RNA polymerase subunit RPABC4/transcription elongation factor Spt4
MTLDIYDAAMWWMLGKAVVIVLVAYVAVLWAALVVWTYRDVKSRTEDRSTQFISMGLVAAFFLPGWLVYLVIRPPETLEQSYERRIEIEAMYQDISHEERCPACRRAVQADFNMCPFCAAALRTPCAACGRGLAASWSACPYCGTEASRPAAAASVTRPAARPAQPASRPLQPLVRPSRG